MTCNCSALAPQRLTAPPRSPAPPPAGAPAAIEFKVTSATGEEGTFQQASATAPVRAACKVC